MYTNLFFVAFVLACLIVGFREYSTYTLVVDRQQYIPFNLKLSVNSYIEVNDHLTNYLNDWDATKIELYRLHNHQGADYKNLDFLSISLMTIVTSDSYPGNQAHNVNLPASLFSEILSDVLEQKYTHVITEEIKENTLKSLFSSQNIKESEWVPLLIDNKKLVGLIAVSYISSPKEPFQDRLAKLQNLSRLVTYSLYKEY